jgi:hypothetical protein
MEVIVGVVKTATGAELVCRIPEAQGIMMLLEVVEKLRYRIYVGQKPKEESRIIRLPGVVT